ncbi:MAG: YIP1 family protein [Pyrinomonadaceae bacterium]
MRRKVAFTIFLIGVIVLVCGVSGILSGGFQFGLLTGFMGALLFALDFAPRHEPAPGAPPPLPLLKTVLGVFYEPSRVFQNLRARPRWVTAFLIIALSSVTYHVVFTYRMTPEKIALAEINKAIEGRLISEDEEERVKALRMESARASLAIVNGAAMQVVGLFIFILGLALLYKLGVFTFGGRIQWQQALSVATYAALPPILIAKMLSLFLLFIIPLEYIDPFKGQHALIRDDLSIFLSPGQHPILYTAATFVSLISLYKIWLTITGLRNGGERVSSSVALTVALSLWGVALGLAIMFASLHPTSV